MYYFYYFQCSKTNLYYGGITSSISERQRKHLTENKSNKKPWGEYQDKIQLITLWNFTTKKEACVYEKQWIINNYKNPLCLNCSVSNSEYDATTEKHKALCEAGKGFKAKVRFALNVDEPCKIHTFQSSIEAAEFTKVHRGHVSRSCKNAKPKNGSGRWLFSDVSIDDLKAKFNNLTQAEIKGFNNTRNKTKGFILIDKTTGKHSQTFYSVLEPQKHGYKIHQSNLSCCLLGKRKSVNGYYVKQELGPN